MTKKPPKSETNDSELVNLKEDVSEARWRLDRLADGLRDASEDVRTLVRYLARLMTRIDRGLVLLKAERPRDQ